MNDINWENSEYTEIEQRNKREYYNSYYNAPTYAIETIFSILGSVALIGIHVYSWFFPIEEIMALINNTIHLNDWLMPLLLILSYILFNAFITIGLTSKCVGRTLSGHGGKGSERLLDFSILYGCLCLVSHIVITVRIFDDSEYEWMKGPRFGFTHIVITFAALFILFWLVNITFPFLRKAVLKARQKRIEDRDKHKVNYTNKNNKNMNGGHTEYVIKDLHTTAKIYNQVDGFEVNRTTIPRFESENKYAQNELMLHSDKQETPDTGINVGDHVTFGHYQQNNDYNMEEDIEWIVLDIQDGNILLLSLYALDSKKYNDFKNSTWGLCSLRSWLNTDFYDTAFTPSEKSLIITADVDNGKKQALPDTQYSGGRNTKDRVFLLSCAEVNKYLKLNELLFCQPTKYALKQKITTYEGGKAAWWLRSPYGESLDWVSIVNPLHNDLHNAFDGTLATMQGKGVRPAIWLNLSVARSIENNEQNQFIMPTAISDSSLVHANYEPGKRRRRSQNGIAQYNNTNISVSNVSSVTNMNNWIDYIFAAIRDQITCAEQGLLEAQLAIQNIENAKSDIVKAYKNVSNEVACLRTQNSSNKKRKNDTEKKTTEKGKERTRILFTLRDICEKRDRLPSIENLYNAEADLAIRKAMLEKMNLIIQTRKSNLEYWQQLESYKTNIKSYKQIGNCVTFGHYQQDFEITSGKKEIEWLVLDVQEEKVLLLSKYAIDSQPYLSSYENNWRSSSFYPLINDIYNDSSVFTVEEKKSVFQFFDKYNFMYGHSISSLSWEECALRTWLNGSFINSAFTEEEQFAILTTHVDNSPNQQRVQNTGLPNQGSNDTWDKIFLLSYAETCKYLQNKDDRDKCLPTKYAATHYSSQFDNGRCKWWTRAVVSNLYDSIGVRPALWLDLKSWIFWGFKTSAQLFTIDKSEIPAAEEHRHGEIETL